MKPGRRREREELWRQELRAARKLHDWTQRQMADELGVSRRTVQRWEDGTQALHPSWMRLVRDLLAQPAA